MKLPYNSQFPHTGVTSYELTDSGIVLEFQHGRFRYLYNHTKPGPEHVAAMIALAAQGKGLSTYVTQHVQDAYAARFPLEQA